MFYIHYLTLQATAELSAMKKAQGTAQVNLHVSESLCLKMITKKQTHLQLRYHKKWTDFQNLPM